MDQRQLFLRDVLTVLFKRKGLILLFAILTIAVVAVGSYVWPETYESVAKLRLLRGPQTLNMDPAVQTGSANIVTQLTSLEVNSEIETLRSENVFRMAASSLDMKTAPLNGNPLRKAFGAVGRGVNGILYALRLKAKPSAEEQAVEWLRDSIDVQQIKDSYVMEVKCTAGSAETAHDVLAAVIEAYIQEHLRVHASNSQVMFEDQLTRVQAELKAAQEELGKYREQYRIVSLERESDLLTEEYARAQNLLNQLTQTEEATEAVEQGGSEQEIIAALSRSTESTVVTELQLRLLELLLQRNNLENTLGPNHPDYRSVTSQIEKALERLRAAITETASATQKSMADIEERFQVLNTRQSELDELESRVALLEDRYEQYAKKREESFINEQLVTAGISSVKVISFPNMPTAPTGPRRLFNLVVALIAGLVAGIALAFFFEYLDHGLKTPEDVEHFLKVPTLASFFRGPYEQLDPKEAQRLVTMVSAMYGEEGAQITQVVSAVAGEGAYRVSRALAESHAGDATTKTLFIDFVGDGIGETPSGVGITDVLTGDATLADALSSVGNLYVIGRGTQDECPPHLLSSKRMQEMLDAFRGQFDRIFMHASPVLMSHDALNLTRLSDGTLIVIKADSTRREVVQRAVEMLSEARGRILGAVLTERRHVIPSVIYRRI